MRSQQTTALVSVVVAWLALACSHTNPTSATAAQATTAQAAVTLCTQPRPEMCTHEYRPVCGCSGDASACAAGIHSSATTWQEYGNACGACTHAEVGGFVAGKCP